MKFLNILFFSISILVVPKTMASIIKPPADSRQPIPSLKNLTSIRQQANVSSKTPTIIQFTTDKNIPVLFVQNTSLPIVDIQLTFNAGSARDAELTKKHQTDLYGVSGLAANLLTKGYESDNDAKNIDDIAHIIEDNGIQMHTTAYKDMFVVAGPTLSDNKLLATTSTLIDSFVSHANFPKQQIDLAKSRRLVSIKQLNERPTSIANRTFMKALYGDHPYAFPTEGTLESINNIEQKHLVDFKNTYLVARNVSIAITGNLSKAQAKQLSNSLTKSLPIGNPAPSIPKPKVPKATHIHIPFDTAQTVVLAGQLGISRQDPKIHELAIANNILGGSDFSALLMQGLRKEKGYTYGVYSRFTPMQVKGPFTISFSTRNEVAKDALKHMKKIVKKYYYNGATREQVTTNKDGIVNSFPLSVATNAQINTYLAMMGFYKLPKDFLSNYPLDILAPTTHAINTAFKQKINPKKMIIVTVGPKKP